MATSVHETIDFITQIATDEHIYSMSFCTSVKFPFTHSVRQVQIIKLQCYM